jgi:hypothetical protein
LIAKYLIQQDPNLIDTAIEMSKEKGYQYEIQYSTALKSKKNIDLLNHNEHFLLFP